MTLTTDFIIQTGRAIYKTSLYKKQLGINGGESTYICNGITYELLPIKHRNEGYHVASPDGVIPEIMWNVEVTTGIPYPVLYVAYDGPKGVKVYGEKVAKEIIKHSELAKEASSYLSYMRSELARYVEMKDSFEDGDEIFNVKKWKCKQRINEYRDKMGIVNNTLAFLSCNSISTAPIFADMSFLRLSPELVQLFMFLAYLTKDAAFSMKLCMLLLTEGIAAKQHEDVDKKIISFFYGSGDYYQIDIDLLSGKIIRGFDSYDCLYGNDIMLCCPQMLCKAARKLSRRIQSVPHNMQDMGERG